MSEENKRTVRTTLNRKFGVSEKRDERRPRRDDDSRTDTGDRPFRREDRPVFKGSDRPGFRGDRPRGLREDGRRREDGEGRFSRERRPRSFGNRPFKKRFDRDARPFRASGDMGAPVYRQRPEQKAELIDENIDETVL